MKSIFTLLSLTTIILVSACAPVNPDQLAKERAKFGTSTQAKVNVTNSSISGTWKDTCVLNPADSMYRQDILEITSNYITSTSNFYSDSKCTISIYSQSLSGLYLLTDDSLQGVAVITVNNSSTSVLVSTSIVATMFNQQSFCKATDWTSGHIRLFNDVTVCGIATTSKMNIQRFGTDELYLNAVKYLKQ